MQTTKLRHTDLTVSRIAFGCMSTVQNPTYDGVADQEGIDVIRAALDHGINFFDTAPAYGDGASEDLLGRALEGVRDKAVIADKISSPTLNAEEVRNECEKSLKLLRTDVIDLYQIHWPRGVVPIGETLRAMENLVDSGKVRVLGVCNFGRHQLAEALDTKVRLVTNQVVYSLLMRAAEFEVAGQCEENNIGLLCYSPLAQGLLAGKYNSADEVPDERARTRHFSKERPQARHDEAGCEAATFEAVEGVRQVAERLGRPMAEVALAWVLHQPGVDCVLAGASRVDQVKKNAAAAELSLSSDDLAELDRLTRPVKEAMGPSLDPWATPSRIR